MVINILIKDFLPFSWAERLQLEAGLVDVQNREAEEGVPHLTHKQAFTISGYTLN